MVFLGLETLLKSLSMKKICTRKRTNAIQPQEREAMAKPLKRADTRCAGMVAKTKIVVMVWRTRWKTAIANCSILLPSLPVRLPNTVIVKASPNAPSTRLPRVTSGRNHLKSRRTKRGTARTRGTENAAA